MFWMHVSTRCRRLGALLVVITATTASCNVLAAGLSLQAAEEMALAADPGVQSIESNRDALDELAVAAAQLPDPKLKMGLISLPTDTFDFGQEAMTQVQLGLVQRFPRGDTRELQSEQIGLRSEGLEETAQDQRLRILLAVREQFIEVAKQRELLAINDEAIRVFSELADITRDYYATGKVNQEDVIQASVEVAKAEERAERIRQEGERARARLATWVGDAAWRDFQPGWPVLNGPDSPDAIRENLMSHPRIAALNKAMAAADTGVELAEQKYKPEFSVDLTYGGRSGTGPNGQPRPDLFTAMVLMDLPLFHKNRQDRQKAASVAQSSAAMYQRDDVYRQMLRQVDLHAATLERQKARLALYDQSLVPEARASALASLEAYQSSVGDLTALLRAQLIEFELRLGQARLQAETLKTRARLLYLQGDSL